MPPSGLEDIRNYRPVDDRLSSAGQPTVAQLESVARAGFEVVINLALHNDPKYSLPDETGLVRSLGMRYVHIPVQWSNPTEADLHAFFVAMDEAAGSKTFVHCAANYRVSAFLGLYRVMKRREPAETAFAQLLALWRPDAVWTRFIATMLARGGVQSPLFPQPEAAAD